MSTFVLVLATHVIAAVAGAGLFGAIPIAAAYARRTGADARAGELFAPLFRYTRVGLVVVFLTGAWLDYIVHGMFDEMIWFRAAAILLIVLGASHARARALAKRADERALRSLERWGWWMCTLVALIAYLMAAKP